MNASYRLNTCKSRGNDRESLLFLGVVPVGREEARGDVLAARSGEVAREEPGAHPAGEGRGLRLVGLLLQARELVRLRVAQGLRLGVLLAGDQRGLVRLVRGLLQARDQLGHAVDGRLRVGLVRLRRLHVGPRGVVGGGERGLGGDAAGHRDHPHGDRGDDDRGRAEVVHVVPHVNACW